MPCPRTQTGLGKEPWWVQVSLVREIEPCGTWAVGQSNTEADGLFCRLRIASVTSPPRLKQPVLGVMPTGRWSMLPESGDYPRLPYSQERWESSQISGACEDTEICCSLQKTGWRLILFVLFRLFSLLTLSRELWKSNSEENVMGRRDCNSYSDSGAGALTLNIFMNWRIQS